MNPLLKALLFASIILLMPVVAGAQGQRPIIGEGSAGTLVLGGGGSTVREQIKLLEERELLLKQRLTSLSSTSADYALVADWIRELEEKLEDLKASRRSQSGSNPVLLNAPRPSGLPTGSLGSGLQAQTKPIFLLSRPVQGATNEMTQLELAWTEDQQPNKTYILRSFIVEVALSDRRMENGRFPDPVYVTAVAPAGVRGQEIKVPKNKLRSGQKYYWQVLAEYVPQGSAAPLQGVAANAVKEPESFKTAAQTFDAFERRHLTLQRAVTGDDAGEGAQFGFLKTFHQKTVYTADFALIYNNLLSSTQRTRTAFQASVQGSLTSAESESEDSLQFRAGVVIDRNLKRNTINHLYISLAAKYEADQKFKVGKLISENMLTPTFRRVGIGVPFGRPSDPIQFRWRPYFYFDLGRSFEKGDSTEVEDAVLRLTPRVRTILTLNFLRRALNMNDTYIFADNSFYFLPLEKTKSRHNMFTSGFVLQVTKDFGFGLTYKSGEAAPKFKPVHTFGGVLTIRFGKE